LENVHEFKAWVAGRASKGKLTGIVKGESFWAHAKQNTELFEKFSDLKELMETDYKARDCFRREIVQNFVGKPNSIRVFMEKLASKPDPIATPPIDDDTPMDIPDDPITDDNTNSNAPMEIPDVYNPPPTIPMSPMSVDFYEDLHQLQHLKDELLKC
jgi:hypothetical protein